MKSKAAKHSARRRRSAISAKEAAKLYRNYLARKPLMTRQQMHEYENAILHSNRTDKWGQARRCALAAVSMPARQLMRSVEEDREGAVAMACAGEMVAKYSKVLNELSELVAEADRRLMIALCGRPDMEEIIDEARRRNMETQGLQSRSSVKDTLQDKATQAIARGNRPRPHLVVSND